MGTPNELMWPGVSELIGWKSNFPFFERKELNQVITGDPIALDLIVSLLHYKPERRLSAEQALDHLFFKDLPVDYNGLL